MEIGLELETPKRDKASLLPERGFFIPADFLLIKHEDAAEKLVRIISTLL
jgi:hypothetical protein